MEEEEKEAASLWSGRMLLQEDHCASRNSACFEYLGRVPLGMHLDEPSMNRSIPG